MSKEDFAKIMTYLGTIYGKQFNKEELTVWYSFFYQVNSNIFKIAIKNLAEKTKYIPSIAEIKNEILRIQNPELKLNAEEQWAEVLKVIRKYGYYQSEKALQNLLPYTREIVEKMNFQEICKSENINWERKVFIETFNACKKNRQNFLIESENEKKILENQLNYEVKNEY